MAVHLVAKFLLVGRHRRGVKTSVLQLAGPKGGREGVKQEGFYVLDCRQQEPVQAPVMLCVYKTVLTDKLQLLITTVHRPAALRQKGKIAYRTVKGCDVTYLYIAFSRGPSQRPLCAVNVSETHTNLSRPETEKILCTIDKENTV
jgi:hypothetical protein